MSLYIYIYIYKALLPPSGLKPLFFATFYQTLWCISVNCGWIHTWTAPQSFSQCTNQKFITISLSNVPEQIHPFVTSCQCLLLRNDPPAQNILLQAVRTCVCVCSHLYQLANVYAHVCVCTGIFSLMLFCLFFALACKWIYMRESVFWHRNAASTEILRKKVGNVGHKGNIAGQFHAFRVCMCVCVHFVLRLCMCGFIMGIGLMSL